MMRLCLILLLLANALLWSWGQGWLGGNPGSTQREPERLKSQQHPERLKLIDPQKAAALLKAAPICRQLGPFADEAALTAAETALQSLNLPAGQAQREKREQGPQWGLVSRPGDAADLDHKRAVLERAGLKGKPILVPGDHEQSLLVSRFDQEAAAQAEAARLRESKGLKALRVVALQQAQTQWWLRVAAWPVAQLKAQDPAWPGGPQACEPAHKP